MLNPASNRWLEPILILVVTVLGAALRFWGSAHLGLTHFDEGIYALAGNWVFMPNALGDLNRSLIPYSPPVFPILIGLSYALFGGMTDLSAIFVSQAAGVLGIPIAGWLGRRTFGPGAGVAAAAFAALSGPHAGFSRVALTDTTFLLAWMIALGLGMRFLERPGWGRAIAFGLAVGLAQNVKYNGYLAGAIVALVAAWDLLMAPAGARRGAARALGLLLVAAGVAALAYLPWFLFIERNGGYSDLIAHHRKYVGGWGSWYPHWRLQMDQQVALSGGASWSMVAWSLAWLGGIVVLGRAAAREPFHLLIGLLSGAAILAFAPNLGWWLALGAAPWMLRDARPSVRVLFAWWAVMSVLTPFYHPYARLWLPLDAAGWLVLAGVVVEGLATRHGADSPEPLATPEGRRRLSARSWAGFASGLVAILHAAGPPRAHPMPGLLGPTDTVQVAMAKVRATLPPRVEGLHMLVRPPVIFYAAGKLPLMNSESLDSWMKPTPTGVWGLVEGSQLRQEGEESDLLMKIYRNWTTYTIYPTEESLPALLDEDPSVIYEERPGQQDMLFVLRPRPRTPSP